MDTLQFQTLLILSAISILLLAFPRFWFNRETWYEFPKLKEIDPKFSRAGIYPVLMYPLIIVSIFSGVPLLAWNIIPGFHGFAIFFSLLNIYHATFALFIGVYPMEVKESMFDKLRIVYIYKEGVAIKAYGAFVMIVSFLMILIVVFLLWLAALLN